MTHAERILGIGEKVAQDKCLDEIDAPGAFNLYCQVNEYSTL